MLDKVPSSPTPMGLGSFSLLLVPTGTGVDIQREATAQRVSAWTRVQLLTKQTKIKCLQSVRMLISQIECCFV